MSQKIQGVTTELTSLPDYRGWKPEEVDAELRDIFASGNQKWMDTLTGNLASLPRYAGVSADTIRGDVRAMLDNDPMGIVGAPGPVAPMGAQPPETVGGVPGGRGLSRQTVADRFGGAALSADPGNPVHVANDPGSGYAFQPAPEALLHDPVAAAAWMRQVEPIAKEELPANYIPGLGKIEDETYDRNGNAVRPPRTSFGNYNSAEAERRTLQNSGFMAPPPPRNDPPPPERTLTPEEMSNVTRTNPDDAAAYMRSANQLPWDWFRPEETDEAAQKLSGRMTDEEMRGWEAENPEYLPGAAGTAQKVVGNAALVSGLSPLVTVADAMIPEGSPLKKYTAPVAHPSRYTGRKVAAVAHTAAGVAQAEAADIYGRRPDVNEDAVYRGRALARSTGIVPTAYQGTNPRFSPNSTKGLTQGEVHDLYSYYQNEKFEENLEKSKEYAEGSQRSYEKADELIPAAARADALQRKASELSDTPGGVIKSGALGWQSFMNNVWLPSIVATGDRETIEKAARVGNFLGDLQAHNMEGRTGLDKFINEGAAVLVPMMPGVLAGLTSLIPGAGVFVSPVLTSISTSMWAMEGAGEALMEVIAKGGDPKAALSVSLQAGMLYAAIESLQVSKVGKVGFSAPVKKSIARAIAKYVAEGAWDTAKELNEEGVQGATLVGSVAKALKAQGFDIDERALVEEMWRTYGKDAVESASGLTAAMLPFRAIGAGRMAHNAVANRNTAYNALAQQNRDIQQDAKTFGKAEGGWAGIGQQAADAKTGRRTDFETERADDRDRIRQDTEAAKDAARADGTYGRTNSVYEEAQAQAGADADNKARGAQAAKPENQDEPVDLDGPPPPELLDAIRAEREDGRWGGVDEDTPAPDAEDEAGTKFARRERGPDRRGGGDQRWAPLAKEDLKGLSVEEIERHLERAPVMEGENDELDALYEGNRENIDRAVRLRNRVLDNTLTRKERAGFTSDADAQAALNLVAKREKEVKDETFSDFDLIHKSTFGGKVYKKLQQGANKSPFAFTKADVGNLGGTNTELGGEEQTNAFFRQTIGKVFINEVNRFGGIVARQEGDEFFVAWPGRTADEAVKFHEAIENKLRKKTAQFGLGGLAYGKKMKKAYVPRIEAEVDYNPNDDVYTGGLYMNYGVIDGDNTTPFRDAVAAAEKILEGHKIDYFVGKIKEQKKNSEDNKKITELKNNSANGEKVDYVNNKGGIENVNRKTQGSAWNSAERDGGRSDENNSAEYDAEGTGLYEPAASKPPRKVLPERGLGDGTSPQSPTDVDAKAAALLRANLTPEELAAFNQKHNTNFAKRGAKESSGQNDRLNTALRTRNAPNTPKNQLGQNDLIDNDAETDTGTETDADASAPVRETPEDRAVRELLEAEFNDNLPAGSVRVSDRRFAQWIYDAVEKAFGIEIVALDVIHETVSVHSPTGDSFDGFYSDKTPGKIYIASDTKRPLFQVISHELWHNLEGNADLKARVTAAMRLTAAGRRAMGEMGSSEFIADYVFGEALGDKAFWRGLAAEGAAERFARNAITALKRLYVAMKRLSEDVDRAATGRYMTTDEFEGREGIGSHLMNMRELFEQLGGAVREAKRKDGTAQAEAVAARFRAITGGAAVETDGGAHGAEGEGGGEGTKFAFIGTRGAEKADYRERYRKPHKDDKYFNLADMMKHSAVGSDMTDITGWAWGWQGGWEWGKDGATWNDKSGLVYVGTTPARRRRALEKKRNADAARHIDNRPGMREQKIPKKPSEKSAGQWRIDNLKIAEEMEAAGKKDSEIKMATGWERGADEKWRYEVLDITLASGVQNLITTQDTVPLGQVVQDHAGLFRMYPGMEKMGVIAKPELSHGMAYYTPRADTITVSEEDALPSNHGTLLRVLTHEIQHVIQNKEGFARGGSGDEFRNPSGLEEDYRAFYDTVAKLDGDMYDNIGKILNDKDFLRHLYDIPHGLEYMYKNDDKKTFLENLKYFAREGLPPILRYRRLAGETEARNAEKRRDMGVHERRGSLARETEDVAREDQDVRFARRGESKDKKNKIGSGVPAPIPPRQFKKLLDRLARTGLAKDVITDADAMRKRLSREFGEEAADRFMSLWHGSPHAFDRFSTAYMGTGEGNQSYGWGLYFTEKRGIAEGYSRGRKTTPGVVVTYRGKQYRPSDATDAHPAEHAAMYVEYNGDVASAKKSMEDTLGILRQKIARMEAGADSDDFLDTAKKLLASYSKALDLLSSNRLAVTMTPQPRPSLYNVKIHGDKTVDELNFIRWDKPLTEKQHAAVVNALKDVKQVNENYSPGIARRDIESNKDYDGYDIYKRLKSLLNSDRAASEFLLRAGIDGIQYPTEYHSKGSHEDAYNYVVFDDKAIEIAEHIRLMSTPDGEVYGFATRDGKIYLDPDKMNANTPIHEYGHLWTDFVKAHNKPLYNRLTATAARSEFYKELKANPAYAHLSHTARAEEALARAIADAGEVRFTSESNYEKFMGFLRDLWNWVSERLGLDAGGGLSGMAAEDVGNLTLAEIADGGARELLGGRRVGEAEGEGTRFALRAGRGQEEITDAAERIKQLWPAARVHEASTGTVYAELNGVRVRIGDHEPNYGAPRSHDYKEIYTLTADNEPLDWLSALARKWGESDEYAAYREGEYRQALKDYADDTPRREQAQRMFDEAKAEEARRRALAATAPREWVVETDRLGNEAGVGKSGDKRRKAVSKLWKRRSEELLGEELTRDYFFKTNTPDMRFARRRSERGGGSENYITEAENDVSSISQAARLIDGLVGIELINSRLNLRGTISRNSLQKITRDGGAIKKSASPKLHALAVANIKSLFERAVIDVTHPDTRGDSDIETIHRVGAFMSYEGEIYPVKITLKQYYDSQKGSRLYSVEALTVEKVKSAGQLADTGRAGSQAPIADFNNKVIEFLDKVNSKDKKNKKSSDAPAPIPPRQFKKLLDRLARTGLAKDVITDADAMRKRLSREFGEGAADRFMSLWHGSPHAFDRFSTAFMGTGEGVQAYGWGLYFTEKREIAEAYTRAGMSKDVTVYVDGKEIDKNSYQDWPIIDSIHMSMRRNGNYSIEDCKEWLRGRIEDLRKELLSTGGGQSDLDDHRAELDFLESHNVVIEPGDLHPNLYNVKIHGDKTVDDLNFIRWDKPLTEEQVEQVAAQAEKEGFGDRYPHLTDEDKNYARRHGRGVSIGSVGEFFYKDLRREMGGSPKAASEFLLRAGIDGIQYPTEYKSKGSHEDTYNYVVFDDKAIEIVEHIRLMSTPDGEVYGFATRDGKIYLDPDKMNANTPIHEYGHLWTDFVKAHNKPLYNRLTATAARSEFYKELKANPAYAHLSHTERAEEALARAIADAGEMRFTSESGYEKFMGFLRDLWNWVAERLGLDVDGGLSGAAAEDVGNLTLAEIAGGGARELLGGRRVGGNYISGGDSQNEGRGDVMAKAEIYRRGMSYSEALAGLRGLLGSDREITLQNKNDGEEARLSVSSIGKMLSNKTVRKSIDNGFTREQHYAVAADIANVFKNSLKLWGRPDETGNPDVFIHRFGAPLNFGDAIAFITVKESRQHGKRVYSTELMEIGKLGGMLEEAGETPLHTSLAPSFNGGDVSPSRLYTDNIRKLREAVNTQGENNFDGEAPGLRFARRPVSDAEKAQRAKDPRWAIARLLEGILKDEGILRPGFGFGDAVVNWGQKPTYKNPPRNDKERRARDDMRKKWEGKWARAQDRFERYAKTDYRDQFVDAGFSEVIYRDDRPSDFSADDVIYRIPEWMNDFEAGIYYTGEANEEVDEWTQRARDAAFESLTEGEAPHNAEAGHWDGHYVVPELEHAGLDKLAKSGEAFVAFTNAGEEFTARRGKDGGWVITSAHGQRAELDAGASVWVDKGHLQTAEREAAALGAEVGVKRADAAVKRAEAEKARAATKQAAAETKKMEAAARLKEAEAAAASARAEASRQASEAALAKAQAAAVEVERLKAEAEKAQAVADRVAATAEMENAELKKAIEEKRKARAEADKAKAEVQKAKAEVLKARAKAEEAKAKLRKAKRTRGETAKELIRELAAQASRLNAIRGKRASTMDIDANRRLENIVEGLSLDMHGSVRKAIEFFQNQAIDDIKNNPERMTTGRSEFLDDITRWREGRGGLPKFVQDAIEASIQESLAYLSVVEMRNLLRIINNIKEGGRAALELEQFKKMVEVEEMAGRLKSRLGAVNKLPEELTKQDKKEGKFVVNTDTEATKEAERRDRSMPQKAADYVSGTMKRLDYDNLRPETIVRMLDGTMGKDGEVGPFERWIFKRILDTYENRLKGTETAIGKLDKIFSGVDLTKATDKLTEVENADGKTIRILYDNAMFVYAHSQNESGRAHLEGSGFTEEGIKHIIAELPKEYRGAVDAVLDYFDNDQYNRMNPVFVREHHIDMHKEPRYMPIRNLAHEDKSAADIIALEDAARRGRANVNKGMTKGRVNSKLAFKNTSFFMSVVPAIREAEHYIAMNDAVRDVDRLLNHRGLGAAMEQKNPQALEQLRDWLKETARGRDIAHKKPIYKLANILKSNYTVAVLGLNLLTSFKQLDSFTQGMVRIKGGVWRVPKALIQMANPFKWGQMWEFAQTNSVMMRNRAQSIEQALTDKANVAGVDRFLKMKIGKHIARADLPGAIKKYREASMWMIQTADMVVVTSLWNARYEETYNQLRGRNKGEGEAHEAATKSADTLIRRTQPMFDRVFLPASLRENNPFLRMFGMFLNQQNQNWNNLHETIMGAKNRGVWQTAWLGAMTHLLPGIIFRALSTGRFWVDDGDDPWDWESWIDEWEDWVDVMAENNFGGMPVIGLVPIAITRGLTNISRERRGRRAKWGGFSGMSPVVGAYEDILEAARGEMTPLEVARLGTQVMGLPGWIFAERLYRAARDGDPAAAVWSKRLRQDTGVKAEMAKRADKAMSTDEYGRYHGWYRNNLTKSQRAEFDKYYNMALDKAADNDRGREFKMVYYGLDSNNERRRAWAEARKAKWMRSKENAYDRWLERTARSQALKSEGGYQREMKRYSDLEELQKVDGRR